MRTRLLSTNTLSPQALTQQVPPLVCLVVKESVWLAVRALLHKSTPLSCLTLLIVIIPHSSLHSSLASDHTQLHQPGAMSAPNPLAVVPPALKKITLYIRRAEELDKDTVHPVSAAASLPPR